ASGWRVSTKRWFLKTSGTASNQSWKLAGAAIGLHRRRPSVTARLGEAMPFAACCFAFTVVAPLKLGHISMAKGRRTSGTPSPAGNEERTVQVPAANGLTP